MTSHIGTQVLDQLPLYMEMHTGSTLSLAPRRKSIVELYPGVNDARPGVLFVFPSLNINKPVPLINAWETTV